MTERYLVKTYMSVSRPPRSVSADVIRRLSASGAPLDYEALGSLVDIFRRQARDTPDALVLVDCGRQWTLGRLDAVTERLASVFAARFAARKAANVAIYMDKCAEYVVAYIAALKAGAAYIPVDISYPSPLLAMVLQESAPAVICVKPEFVSKLAGYEKQCFIFEDDWESSLSEDVLPLPEVGLDDVAYIVYSSGTTGKPKGIQCPHRGAVLSYQWRFTTYPYIAEDRVACNVFFVWELFRPILRGVQTHIIPDDVIYDPPALCAFLEKSRISQMLFTPSLLETLLDTVDSHTIAAAFRHFRHIFLCGEVVTVSFLERVVEALRGVQVVNLYSVSECHDVADCDLTAWLRSQRTAAETSRKFAPVGRVLPGVRVVILDEHRSRQPVGVPGEIFVGGPTLAIGYLNRPEIDLQRFIDAPDSLRGDVGPRLYRTGDWGYLLADGGLEICGRCDTLVKIRGYSIEIQAVESILLQLPYVLACAVVSHGDEGDEKQLAAYVVLNEPRTRKEIRAALKRRLPFYMIPTFIVFVDKLPVLPASSKVDRKALPAVRPDEDMVQAEQLAQTSTERRLSLTWSHILNLKAVDIQESFFDLGGHSLLAARLLKRIGEEFDSKLAVRDLFENPTVSAMARLLEGRDTSPVMPALDLNDEVKRHDIHDTVMDLHLRAFWRSIRWTDWFSRAQVLLTGATGFLGAFVLRDLLRLSEVSAKCPLYTVRTAACLWVRVVCLIREAANASCRSRLEDALRSYALLDAALQEQLDSRVSIVTGDIALVQFGLNDDDYHSMTYDVDVVIHAAAYVNLIYPYEALHGCNVLGTQNVLMFCQANKIKALHYVSTNAVIAAGLEEVAESDTLDDCWQTIGNGYGQSKWVAEQLVVRAQRRGMPVVVYRLGNQAGDSETGYWNRQDFIYLLLYGCVTIGAAPRLDWQIEMTPVDFTSRFIVTVATQRLRLDAGKLFHLVNTRRCPWSTVTDALRRAGYGLLELPFGEWAQRVEQTVNLQAAADFNLRLLDSMIRDGVPFEEESTVGREGVDLVLSELQWPYPEPSEKQLRHWLRMMARADLLPRPSTSQLRPLNGRVCVVTGASSGIGEAVAFALAVEGGANVVAAARRLPRLEELQARIAAAGGDAVAALCDVTDREQVASLMATAETSFGPIDVLVNCAGIMFYNLMEKCDEQQWQQQIDLNCKGLMNCIGAVLQSMVARKSGHIVNISSDAGKKFFVEGMSAALRQEMAPHRVKVTTVQPGDVNTGLAAKSTDAAARQMYDGTLTGHTILEPEDVARAVLFALRQPENVAVNELLVEPTAAPI